MDLSVSDGLYISVWGVIMNENFEICQQEKPGETDLSISEGPLLY